jgi:hypothetical protein
MMFALSMGRAGRNVGRDADGKDSSPGAGELLRFGEKRVSSFLQLLEEL